MGRANPNCANASNPYHECSPACSQKSKPHSTTKRTSGYGRSVTDGEVGKKVNEKRRTYASGCTKASNPYHHCDDNCHKRLWESGAPPPLKLEISKRKQLVTKPDNREVKSHTPSGEIQVIPDVKKEQTINEEDKVASHVDNSEQVLTTCSAIANEDRGDTESVMSEYRSVPVEGYNVKESFAPILRSILDKYGDIGASCHLESVAMRSYYIECVCFVVQELQSASSSLIHLNQSKLNELLAIVNDVESAQLQVAWLQSVLDEIAQLIGQHQHADVAKPNSDGELESLREELESQLQTLAQKEQEVADIKTRIPEIRDRLSKLENEPIVDNLLTKSLIDELL